VLPENQPWMAGRYGAGQLTYSLGGGRHLMTHKDAKNAVVETGCYGAEFESLSLSWMSDEADFFNSGLHLDKDSRFLGPGAFIGKLSEWDHGVISPKEGVRVSLSLYLNKDTLMSAKMEAMPVQLKTASSKSEADAVEKEFARAIDAVFGASSSSS